MRTIIVPLMVMSLGIGIGIVIGFYNASILDCDADPDTDGLWSCGYFRNRKLFSGFCATVFLSINLLDEEILCTLVRGIALDGHRLAALFEGF